jgi:hypothetical protein
MPTRRASSAGSAPTFTLEVREAFRDRFTHMRRNLVAAYPIHPSDVRVSGVAVAQAASRFALRLARAADAL